MELGVCSLKVEGRMRSIHYIATVINLYRKLIDNLYENPNYEITDWYQTEADRAANREYAIQNFDKYPTYKEQYYSYREEKPTKEFIGIVLEPKDDLTKIEQRNYFETGDEIEIFGPKTGNKNYTINKILDENKNEINVARHPRQILYLEIPFKVEQDDLLRDTKNMDIIA